MSSIVIDGRFNGPPDSGNGGYVCGVVGAALGGPCSATLRKPPPLHRELSLESAKSGQVTLRDQADIVCVAKVQPLTLDIPEAPSFEEAVEASRRFPGYETHPFPTCFVCGPGRPARDGMNIFPGWIEERQLVAAPWTPDTSMPNQGKRLHDEIVWAALDCTGYFPHLGAAAVLARLHAEILHPTRVAERYVVAGWQTGVEGRRLWSGSAVFAEDGRPLALAASTWVVLKPDQTDFRVAT